MTCKNAHNINGEIGAQIAARMKKEESVAAGPADGKLETQAYSSGASSNLASRSSHRYWASAVDSCP